MKASDGRQAKNRKWSIKECENKDGWKLKDVRRKQVKAESLDGAKIMREIYTTNFDSKFHDRYWRVGDIHLVENDKIKSQFEEYKNELVALGRSSDMITETVVFSAEVEKSCRDICQDGYKVGSKKKHVLGHTGSGVHLVRHYDILTRYLMFQQYTSPAYILVYKTFLGKTKPIVPRLHKDDNHVPPYSGFDSHVSARQVDKDMPICEALNCSYVYLYEFDQIASNPVKYPRQILPYAIIQLEKKYPCIPENPFLAIGSDEKRSTWEVKGETRRGFRFMFTKSGLKGKHKDFTKTLSRKNIGSHLKGQILEMRTKSANSMSEAKPPLLQKIDDRRLTDTRNEDLLKTSKPPNLQKFISNCTQSTRKNEKFTFDKEFENIVIPKSVRDILKISNFKPCVKLKRLDSSYLREKSVKGSVRNKNWNETSKTLNDSTSNDSSSSGLIRPDPDSSSVKANTTVSEVILLTTDKDKIETCEDGQRRADTHASDCKSKEFETGETRLQDINIKTDKTKSVFVKVSEPNRIGPRKSRKTNVNLKQLSQGIIEEKSACSVSAGNDETENESHAPKDKTAKERIVFESDTCNSIKPKSASSSKNTRLKTEEVESKVLEKEKLSKIKNKPTSLNHRFDTTPMPLTINVFEKKDSFVQNISNSSDMDRPKESSVRVPKRSPDSMELHSNTEDGEIQTCFQTKKADLQETKIAVQFLKNKTETSYFTLKAILRNEQISLPNEIHTKYNTSLGKDDQSISKSNECSSFGNSAQLHDKHTIDTRKSEEKKAHAENRKANPPCDSDKEKSPKKLSTRCAPTKTKFGRVVYTIKKNRAGIFRKYSKDKNQSRNHTKDSMTNSSVNESKEYDFFARRKSLIEENNSFETVTSRENRRHETVYKGSETEYSGNESKNMLSFTNLSGIVRKSKLSDKNKTEEMSVHSEMRRDAYVGEYSIKTAADEPGITRTGQTSSQNQALVLEKSKSPVIASAAPDILNASPVLVSAQTSISPCSKCHITYQNDPLISEEFMENDNNRAVTEKSNFMYKNSFFLSEMSSIYDNRNCVKSLGLIEHFPKPPTKTHIVNPVLRATFGTEIPVKSFEESKVPDSSKKYCEETILPDRKQEFDASIHETDPRNVRCSQQSDYTSESKPTMKSMTKKMIGRQRNNAKTSDAEKRSQIVSKQKVSCQSSDDNTLCGPGVTSKKQSLEESNLSVPFSNYNPNENVLISHFINNGHELVEVKSKVASRNCGSRQKPSEKNDKRNNVKEKQVTKTPSTQIIAPCLNESSKSNINKDFSSSGISDKNVFVGSCKHTGNKIDSNKLESKRRSVEVNTTETRNEVCNENMQLKHERKNVDGIHKENSDVRILLSDDKVTYTDGSKMHLMQSVNRRPHSDCNENASYVKIDTLTAGRLRSFLGTTAAVAMQRKKSDDQKSDSSADDNNIVCTSVNDQGDSCLKTENDSPRYEKLQSNNETNESFSENRDGASQPTTMKSSISTSKTKDTVAHIKEPRITHIKQNRRRDSAEMHDNDSQDTVIGGVTYLNYSPLRPQHSESSNENANLKHFETLLTELRPKVFLSDIKQEKEDCSYEKRPIQNAEVIETHRKFEADVLPETESQRDAMSIVNEVKKELVDEAFDSSHSSNQNENIKTHSVKTELCNSTSFFPRTRRELAKGATMLSANECRSAIVDTLRELSSVLKFLSDSSLSSAKQTEKVAVVAQEMNNVLSGDKSPSTVSNSTTRLDTSIASNLCNPYLDVHIKTEPVDTHECLNHHISETNLEDSNVTSHNNMHRSEEEKQDYVSDEQEFKYNYTLDSYDNVHRNAYEIESKSFNTFARRKENEVRSEMEHDRVPKQPTDKNETILSHEHAIDALPRLFDPREQPDITCLEEFGIPRELCRNENKRTETKVVERQSTEKLYAADNDSNVRPSVCNELSKNIKTERNTDESSVKPKTKQVFNFKTGLLNKGLKERKNMFDLKINTSKRKQPVKTVNRKNALKLEKANDQIPTELDNLCTTTEEFESCSKENHSVANHKKLQENVLNKVYDTVCEKLLSLKGESTSENTLSRSIQSPTSKRDLSDDSKSIDLRAENMSKKSKENECTSSVNYNQAKDKNTKTSVKDKGNVKKHAIIPFKTVLQLKRRQYQKYIRGESNKKFIDYSEILPKMYTKKLYQPSEKSSNTPKNRKTSEEKSENSFQRKIYANEHQGKKFVSCKTSEMSNRSTTLIVDRKGKEVCPEKEGLKRHNTNADEIKTEKRIKLSVYETDKSEPRSNRSRSKSSHRSSENGRNRSRDRSLQLHSDQHKCRSSGNCRKDDYDTNMSHEIDEGNCQVKPIPAVRTRKLRNRSYSTQSNRTTNQYHGPLGKPLFKKTGTGYFSWRRKYQPRRNLYDGFVVTKKGSVQTVAEYAEWTRFKERESLRIQIENAIKEYRRTFERTPDDRKGDEKVANYLSYLTEKLDKIQVKRNKMNMPLSYEAYNDKFKRNGLEEVGPSSAFPRKENRIELLGKLENSQKFHQHEMLQHSSLSKFSGSLASDSDSLSYKQRRHASGIEELLKEHINKHCEHLTKKIKQEISKEMKERKTSTSSSTATCSSNDHINRPFERDYDRKKYNYKGEYIDGKYRRHSRERYDSKPAKTDGALRSRFDKYESMYETKGNGYKEYNRVSRDMYDKGKYTSYETRRDNKHEIRRSHWETYGQRHYPYPKHYSGEYELQPREDYYSNLTTFDVSKSVETKAKNGRVRGKDYTKTYDYQQNYDKYQDRCHEHYHNEKTKMYGNKYQVDNTHRSGDIKNINENFRSVQTNVWFKGKYNKFNRKSVKKYKYQLQDKNDDKDGEADLEQVQDEFDATNYRKFIPSSYKRGRVSFRGFNRFQSSYKRSYQPAKFSRKRNPPTYFDHNDNQGKDNKDAKTTPA